MFLLEAFWVVFWSQFQFVVVVHFLAKKFLLFFLLPWPLYVCRHFLYNVGRNCGAVHTQR